MDLSSHYAEKWIDYPHLKGLSFLLRWYPDEKRLSLIEKHTTIAKEGKEVFDNEGFAKDAINHMIVDWRGMKDNGKKARCSLDLKYKLITIAPEITDWISTVCQLRNVFHHDIDGILKNFQGLLNIDDNGRKKSALTEVE